MAIFTGTYFLQFRFHSFRKDLAGLSPVSRDTDDILVDRARGVVKTQSVLKPFFEEDYIKQWQNSSVDHDDSSNLSSQELDSFKNHIMGKEAGGLDVWRLECPASVALRYTSLSDAAAHGRLRYFFALDLYQAQVVLLTLMKSIVQTILFLGPHQCAVSIIEGRSTDGTYQILRALKDEIENLGATFFLTASTITPMEGDRFEKLAFLRNMALAPIMMKPEEFSADAQVIYLNDVYICPHDILELIYQQIHQKSIMTCGMDWSEGGAIFYDIYVSRSIVGETFWQIAQDGLWHFAANLFWADRYTQDKYSRHQPFPVFACWNGVAVIVADPIMKRQIHFRGSQEGECKMSECTLFSKDLWRLGLGRIQVVPTVNVGYDNQITEIKDQHGRVEDHLNMTSHDLQTELIQWQDLTAPSLVKCMPSFPDQYWVPAV
ncbi:hypothetical protein MMC09_004934 [Bachmanniomyces sp. S44760]|nr:hypothetical protein [Bachmanniomyces sp. S44760]